MGYFLPLIFSGQNLVGLPLTFVLQYSTRGNGIALEPSVIITYDITAASGIPSGAVMVYRNVSVTADDIDSELIN